MRVSAWWRGLRARFRPQLQGDATPGLALPPGDAVAERLARLLPFSVDALEMGSAMGWRRRTHLVVATDGAGRRTRLVLKHVKDLWHAAFYEEILRPLGLNSPAVYGHVDIAGRYYVVMEYIPHQHVNVRHARQLRQTAGWLAHKDAVCGSSLAWMRDSTSWNSLPLAGAVVEQCLEIIRRGVEDGEGGPLAPSLQFVLDRRSVIADLAADVFQNSPSTLCHFDFHPPNVLVGRKERRGELFVVDWSPPHIDSVCIDLAQFVGSVPGPLRRGVLDSYYSQVDFPRFEEIFRRAQLLNQFYYVTWDVQMIRGGRRDLLGSPQFHRRLALVKTALQP